ncbi:MAG: hypothetical protein IPI49_33615 [Myxococcales bacterium]|nr:hypothetical protein [Myxococcales bacterium]
MTDLDRWLQAATSPEHKDYRAAIRALAQLGPSIATQIVELLRSRGGDAVMPVVLRWPGAAVVEHLAPLLAGKDHEAAWRATHLLGQSRAAEAVAPLVAQLERSGRQMAARALGECGQAAAVAPLLAHAATLIAGTDNVDAMADEDPAAPEQLAHVLHALGRLGDSSLAPWLVRLADTAPEPQEREAAVLALADVPVAEALAVASRALGGSTGPLRRAGLLHLVVVPHRRRGRRAARRCTSRGAGGRRRGDDPRHRWRGPRALACGARAPARRGLPVRRRAVDRGSAPGARARRGSAPARAARAGARLRVQRALERRARRRS